MTITFRSLDGWLSNKDENETAGIPLNTTLTYVNGQLTQVVKGSVTKDLTYNMDDTLNTLDDGTRTKTFGYTAGNLTSITVTLN